MPYLRNFMGCSRIEFCGNDDEWNVYLNGIINNPYTDEYFGLKKELKEILDDKNYDYFHLLINDEYELMFPYDPYLDQHKDPVQLQYEAKKFIIDRIWNRLYPEDRMDI